MRDEMKNEIFRDYKMANIDQPNKNGYPTQINAYLIN
jgi:hypothetical protein